MDRPPRILFAGGGTGGHVYPAIAIADAVRRIVPDAAIRFAGTRDRMEWEAVPKAGYQIDPITISGFYRGQPLRNLTLPIKIVRSLLESRHLVNQFDPDVAVGTGGYVSGPVLLTASMLGKPIVIQEQNAYAGVTNRLLGKRAARIHVAFVEAKDYVPPERCVFSGNPTRRELTAVSEEEGRGRFEIPDDAFVIFVFGGSLGSRALNEAMAAHLSEILADEQVWIIWQTGKRYFADMSRRVEPHPRMRILEYVDRMDLTYAASDVTVCRSGAITCSELMVTGMPAILVPSPNVAEDHQTHNARSMQNAGAAILLPEAELDRRLVKEITRLQSEPDRREAMTAAARRIARPDAADTIARDVLAIAETRAPGAGADGGRLSDNDSSR